MNSRLNVQSSSPCRLIRFLALSLLLALGSAAPAMAQMVKILVPSDQSVSYRDKIGVIARGQPNFGMTLYINGNEIKTATVRPDMQVDFLNLDAQIGPNLIKVVERLPNGMVWADSVTLYVGGPAAKILLETEPPTLPADSLSQATVTVQVLDQWGIPLADGRVVTLNLNNGRILSADLYPDQSGTQLQIREGKVVTKIASGTKIGLGRLQAEADGVVASSEIGYTQPFERWTLTGTAIGQIGFRKNKTAPAGVKPDNAFDSGAYGEGKFAFFGRGSVGGGFLLTTSFDSDRRFDNRVFRFLTPDKFFPIHGDASSIFYESPTTGRFYARVSHNLSFVQFGDFSTEMGSRELVSYSRTFSGVSSAIKHKYVDAKLFATSTDQTIQVDELPGEGIGGNYYLSAARLGIRIVEGSERVYIQERDRLHPENVLKEDVKYRFTDYEIDYDAGTIRFKSPIPFLTPDENPVIILVNYETARAVKKYRIGGGRVGFAPSKTISIGATVVGEERANEDFWLTGFDTEWRATKNTVFASEVARTSEDLFKRTSAVGGTPDGWAWKLGVRGKLKEKLDYELYYRDADRNFDNASSPTARPGVRKIRGRAAFSPWNGVTLATESFQEKDDVNLQDRISFRVGSSVRYKTFNNQLSLETTQVERQVTTSRSSILIAGTEWKALNWWTIGARREQSFGAEDVTYRPTLNALTSKIALNNRITLVTEHKFRDQSFIDSSFTAVGIQSKIGGGFEAYANYELDGGINGYKNQALVGLRHSYRPHKFFTLNTGIERVASLRGAGQDDFTAFSIASEFLPPTALKSSTRYEQRNGRSFDKSLASLAFDFTVKRSLSLLAKHTYYNETRAAGLATGSGRSEQVSHQFLTGLAYRSISNDFLNVLGKYEFKYEKSNQIIPAIVKYTHVGSIEAILEPRSQLEWFIRYGFKVNSLNSEGVKSRSLTDLWMTNLRYEWHRHSDILTEYRLLFSHSARDFRHGASGEVGLVPERNMRVAVGYNFVGFEDIDFSGNSYWAHGPFLKFQVKFTESNVAGLLSGLQGFLR